MISRFYLAFGLILVFAGFQTALAQYTGRAVENEPENVAVLFNNGDFTTGTKTESGVSAPEGFVWSENQHDTGNMTESNTALGFGASFPPVRLADNFTVPDGQTWKISSVTVWGFVQNWTAPQSPFAGGVLQIWDGRPGDPGSQVIFGDLETDRLLSTTPSNTYVISNTVAPAPGINPDLNRFLWVNKLSVAPTLTLGPGTYWIEFATNTFSNGTQFYRQVVVPGSRTQNGWDARQYLLATNVWQDVLDNGRPTSAPDVPQDIAFHVNGTVASSNNASKFADYDGDGKTDFGITRWGPAPNSPTEWFILKSGGTAGEFDYNQFGLRAGTSRTFNGVFILDTVLPADYDGDGKADIAIFDGNRASASQPETHFYIINSSDGSLRIEQFGTRGDNASIMGDYDGDGKADLAVWRQGATTGAQSTFYVKRSSDDQLMSVDWGIRGDRPVLGDYDGDGKQDFSVARVNVSTGESMFYTLRSSDGQYTATQLPFPAAFIVPGDYDGDGRDDIAVIKSVVDKMNWTIIRSSDGITESINCGTYSSDFPAQGDYDGDGKTDLAVFRKTGTSSADPSSFWVRQADGSFSVINWGNGFDNSIASIRAY
ncbi:MAG: VCBS repeat-containing protein [Pyrinomonadaceae bacterium]